ncbi:MAG TPA: FUSC family protein, partial [Geobacteraceae bacterium]|nr:FUSC family protein [Geobacteraceae bacterium]
AMSSYLNPAHVYDIAFGRVACIVVGIIVSTGVTALHLPRQSRDELENRLGRVTEEAVTWLALLLRQSQAPGSRLERLERDILIEIAGIEGVLDDATAGTFRFKQQKRQNRNLLASLLSLLAIGRLAGEQLARYHEPERRHREWRELLARHLDEVAGKMAGAAPVNCLSELTAVVDEVKGHLPLLGETLTDMVSSLQLVLAGSGSMATASPEQAPSRLIRHRDWQEARRAGIRAALAIAAVGGTWALAGWSKGPLMLMAISIMISIFSTKEHPAGFVGQIFIGAAIGSATAVFCRLVLLPGVTDPFMIAAIIAPFLLLGVFAMQRRRTAIAATDATLFFLFISQPGVSVAVLPDDLALGAVAMLMGVGSAWCAYRYLVPINPAIRLRSLMAAIMADVERLATADSSATVEKVTARLHHRVIRLVAMTTFNDTDHRSIVEGGIAALAVTGSIRRLRERLVSGDLPSAEAGVLRDALEGVADLVQRPGDPRLVLEAAARTLYKRLGTGLDEPYFSRVSSDAAASSAGRTLDWEGRRQQCPT